MTKKQEDWLAAELMDSMRMPEDRERIARRYVGRAADKVLVYCNRDDLPDQLLNTVVQMAEDMLKADHVVEDEKEVASITRGDTAITYRDGTGRQQSAIDFIKNYEISLNRFKKMNLPKDKSNDGS